MAKLKVAKVFDQTAYKGGGSIINPGLYRIEKSRFAMFDFMGKADEKACLSLTTQPVDKDYKAVGEESVHFFPGGLTIPDATTEEFIARQSEMRPSKDGKKLEIPEDADLSKRSDLWIFMESLAKGGFDMDAAEDDVSSLDGWVVELGVKDDPNYKAPAVKDDDDEKAKNKKKFGPRQLIYVVSIPKQKDAKKSSPKGDEDAPKGKGKGKDAPDESPSDAAEFVEKFLAEKVCIARNEDGIDRSIARAGLKKFVLAAGADSDVEAEAQKIYSDNKKLSALLPDGWELDKASDEIKKG